MTDTKVVPLLAVGMVHRRHPKTGKRHIFQPNAEVPASFFKDDDQVERYIAKGWIRRKGQKPVSRRKWPPNATTGKKSEAIIVKPGDLAEVPEADLGTGAES